MRLSTNVILSFIVLIFFGTSCKSAKKLSGDAKLKKRSAKYLLKKIEDQKNDFEWLSLKARVKYQDDYQSISGTTNIRLKKDSIIWINVKKFSIEGARVLITPDSVFLIDRLNRQFAKTDFSYLERMFKFPYVYSPETNKLESLASFESIQNIILGNAVILPSQENSQANLSNQYELKGDIDKDFSTQHNLEGQDYRLTHLHYNDKLNRQTLDIQMDDYRPAFGSQFFSYFRNVNMNSAETGKIGLEVKISSAEFNVPKSIIFEIPSRYKRIE